MLIDYLELEEVERIDRLIAWDGAIRAAHRAGCMSDGAAEFLNADYRDLQRALDADPHAPQPTRADRRAARLAAVAETQRRVEALQAPGTLTLLKPVAPRGARAVLPKIAPKAPAVPATPHE